MCLPAWVGSVGNGGSTHVERDSVRKGEIATMPFIQTVMPQYRDADADGLIGIRGCTRYFQDAHTWFMHNYDKGNDVLIEEYGAAWVCTRYHVKLYHRIDFTDRITWTTWMEPYRQPVLANINVIIEQHGRTAAVGKIENCLIDLNRQRPLRFTAVDFPEGVPEEIPNDIPRFIRLQRTAEGMEERYEKTVRYSDLDKSRHMNNLRFVEMFEDAFDSRFWEALSPTEMEISFCAQCREGERLSVRAQCEDDRVRMAALHEDGTVASVIQFLG